LPHVLREILAFVDFSWADDKNNRRSSLAYYRKLFLNHITFSWRATSSQSVELSTAEAELMALAGGCWKIVWARKFAIELGFRQLKPTDVHEDDTGCIALASNMHLRGRSKHIALRVCCIQKLIQDGILIVKREAMPYCGANCRHMDKDFTSCTFRKFTDQLPGDNHVCDK